MKKMFIVKKVSKEILILNNIMSYFDTGNDEYECTMVYLCKKCDDAKPLEDFYNKLDDKTHEDIYYKTCKECREKTKATKERNKNMSATWVKEFIEGHYAWQNDAREYKLTAYKGYKLWATQNDKGVISQKLFDMLVLCNGDIEEGGQKKEYYENIVFEPALRRW